MRWVLFEMMCPIILAHKIEQLTCEIVGRKNTIYDLPAKGYAVEFAEETRNIECLEIKREAYEEILNDKSGKEKETMEMISDVMFKSRGWN